MRSGSAWLLGLTGAALTDALALDQRDTPAVLAVPIVQERGNSRQISKRSQTVDFDFNTNSRSPYLYINEWRLNFTLGTPPLPFEGYLDTLSNGAWVLGWDETCEDSIECDHGRYVLGNSSTGKKADEEFKYDEWGAPLEGFTVTDIFKIGDTKVDNMTFAVLDMSEDSNNIWGENNIGIGYGNASTSSLIQVLVDTGAINSAAVSVWNETVLFGGVNKAKYEGDLYTFDTVMGNSSEKALRINMDGISINGSSEASNKFPLDALFGNLIDKTYVPKSVAQALNSQIGLTKAPDEYGQVNFSCKSISQDQTITFKFGKLDLEFDLSLFISRGSFEPTKPWIDVDSDVCFFEIVENKFSDYYDASILLGSNFMSLIYSVFDLENGQISLAKRKYDNSPDDIVEISSGKDGVPGAKDSAGALVGGDLSMTALVAATAMLIMAF